MSTVALSTRTRKPSSAFRICPGMQQELEPAEWPASLASDATKQGDFRMAICV